MKDLVVYIMLLLVHLFNKMVTLNECNFYDAKLNVECGCWFDNVKSAKKFHVRRGVRLYIIFRYGHSIFFFN